MFAQLYVHHYGSSFDFVAGSGAELRGSFIRKTLPEPYVQLVNGTHCADIMPRMTNIQLINTGLPVLQAGCWLSRTAAIAAPPPCICACVNAGCRVAKVEQLDVARGHTTRSTHKRTMQARSEACI